MSAFAYSTQAVERRNADAGSEISVGTSTHRGFFQFPIELPGNGLRLLVKRGDARRPLHGKTVDAALNAQLAALVEWLESPDFAIEMLRLTCALDADIDLDLRLGGDHVG